MQIAVVGCGWLGLPLALSLQEDGHKIVATRRSDTACAELTELGFESIKFELGEPLTQHRLSPIFLSDILILNIPFGRKKSSSEDFVIQMKALLNHSSSSHIKQVIFVSTTSVYGENCEIVSEESPTLPSTQSGKTNLAIEQAAREYFTDQGTIIRLSGLVGRDRHPVKYLAGKTALTGPNKMVNLVHQQDVVEAISQIIQQSIWGKTLVLAANAHPTRMQYYTWAAKQFGLVAPSFVAVEGAPSGKVVDSSESLKTLNMSLNFPSPYDMLDNLDSDK